MPGGDQRRRGNPALAVIALAAGRPHSEVAELAGWSDRTLGRRLRDEKFVAEVRAARSRVIELALGQLAGASSEAVSALVRLLNAEQESVQVSAARAILEYLAKFRADQDLDQRLRQLEFITQQLAAQGRERDLRPARIVRED